MQKICSIGTRRVSINASRSISSLKLWHEDISTEIKLKIEKNWRNAVQSGVSKKERKKTYYVLPMFPYPSGNLHMGHVRVYSISDTISRYHKLNGHNVIHPFGWDAFGLPAENAAIERNILPEQWTSSNIATMKKQILQLGFEFDWSREISTCDPSYYKWTQLIFLKLFEKDMVYQSKALVNWDPVDKTVLADEQVDEFGCSWRSGAKVEKKILKQWFIRTTKYAKKLYDGLNGEYLENWKDIINLQKHWIGECNGVAVDFTISTSSKNIKLNVWSSELHKFIHGQFLTVSTGSVILEGLSTEEIRNLKCTNPITNCELPIFITNEIEYPEGRDVYIACPISNTKDKELALSLSIPIIKMHNEIDLEYDNKHVVQIAQAKNVGGHFVSSKLKDWLISRQRFWGTPIPIVHCGQCGAVPVPCDELPVKLPKHSSVELGIQSLATFKDWLNCKCPKCNLNAVRETDTMDTFVDSSWYYYRFLDPNNDSFPFAKEKVIDNMPVNLYIGGKEHAVLHLYYARFMSYFLYSLGWTPTEEPFKKLLVQGLIMGQSYKLKSSGKYVSPDQVEKTGKEYKEKVSGEPILSQWEKMSKSKHNGENPERLLSTYGCDTTRLLILADVPPETSRRWSDATLPGILNWQHRLWITIRDFLKHRNNNGICTTNALSKEELDKYEYHIWESRNYFTATATYHFQHTQKISVGISRLQSLTSTLRNKLPPEIIANSKEFELALASLIIMLSPVAPHFCSELWSGLVSAPNRVSMESPIIRWNGNVLDQKWPKVDDHYKLSLLCKVDGADRCDLKIQAKDLATLSHQAALQIAMKEVSVSKRLKYEILKTKYELYPGCRAILHIFTNRKQNLKELKQTKTV